MKPLALVIDRDAGTRKLLEVLLCRFGYEVDRVGVSADALTLLEMIDYDFVLSDDFAVAEWMSIHRAAAVSRMMILSSALDSELKRMRALWPNVRVIRKPFELAAVIAASRAAADRPRAMNGYGAAETFFRRSITHGAKSGVIVRRNGDQLELVAKFGYKPGAVEAFFPLTVNDSYPICVTARHGRPVWIASIAGNHEYPLLAEIWRTNESRAIATMPILRDREVIGAAGWTFREPQRFTEAEQRAWLELAGEAAKLAEGGGASHSTSRAGA